MQDQTRETLGRIVEKSEKLRRFGLENQVKEIGLGFSAQRQEDDSWIIEFKLPDEEKQDAFLLTFRFFHQQNESTSLHKLLELGQDPGISDTWRTQATELQNEYFEYLDGHSDYSVNLFEGKPTIGSMLDAGLYGGLAHANRKAKVAQYRQWTRDGVRANVFHQEFSRILIHVLGIIYRLSELSVNEIRQDAY